MMRVGILGGSFNPPHLGHLSLATTVLDLGLVDRVLLIPAATPPHKATPKEDAATRLAMTCLLAEEDSRLAVDGLELERNGKSYTIDTVLQLSEQAPGDSYRLIIGSDLAQTFTTWREYAKRLELSPPLIAERPDSKFFGSEEQMYPGMTSRERELMQAGRFAMQPVDMSSTKVRAMFAADATDTILLTCLTEKVLRFCRANRLYRWSG